MGMRHELLFIFYFLLSFCFRYHQINSCEIISEKSCDDKISNNNNIKRPTNASNPVPINVINQEKQQVKISSSFASSGNNERSCQGKSGNSICFLLAHSNQSISPCSSMLVAYGGSYDCSVYKRLMRSMSSSLSIHK